MEKEGKGRIEREGRAVEEKKEKCRIDRRKGR